MEFGTINLINVGIILIMMIPNLIYAGKGPVASKPVRGKIAVIEQVGRYASLGLMVFPLGVWKFGFFGKFVFIAYLFGNAVLLLAYLTIWLFFFRKETIGRAMALAILPVGIFVLTGVCLEHWLLVLAAVLFAVGHVDITFQSFKE